MSEILTEAATLKKLEVIIRPGKLDAVKKAVTAAGYGGVTISQAEGHGSQKGLVQEKQGGGYRMELVPKLRMEFIVPEPDVEPLIEAIARAAKTGEPGDGKIFIYDVRDAIRIRTGERGPDALK
jgi:nitrogen regulatory protein P-II 1